MSRARILPYLNHLQGLAEAGEIDTILVVDVRPGRKGKPTPTVAVFAEDADEETADKMVEHMREIGKLIHTAGCGGPYPPIKPLRTAPWDDTWDLY